MQALGAMNDTSALLALVKYWICADQLRSSFFDAFRSSNPGHLVDAHGEIGLSFYWVSGPGIFSSLWFASLFVVIEGYRELALSDTNIDRLLKSDHVEALRLYRNATFHFQTSAFHCKMLPLHETHESEQWIDEIHRRIGAFLSRIALGVNCGHDQPDASKMRTALATRLAEDDDA